MNSKRTLDDLNNTVWYRTLKVLYCLFFFVIAFAVNGIWLFEMDGQYAYNFILGDLGIIAMFFIFRNLFYYIALGSFYPKK